jgi:rhodanese-related sulfurtransferase
MSAKVIDAISLEHWLKEKEAPILLHVLPEESYNRKHLPGAQRATVYEVSFLDQVRAIVTDPNRSIVVYGAGYESKEASAAADKLVRAGFTDIWEFAGGLEAWREQDFAINASNPLAVLSGSMLRKAYCARNSAGHAFQ